MSLTQSFLLIVSHAVSITHLREFLEIGLVEANNNRPLNPGSERQYVIICTHCHYDHIGGIEQFSRLDDKDNRSCSAIIASARGRDFIENDLPEHSICKYMGIPTPRYKVSYWAEDFDQLKFPLKPESMDMEASQILPASASDLGITIVNTPGHTPDELAWYDHNERHLYVGDSFYEEGEEGMAILFPKEGDWVDYMSSMTKLLDFVRKENVVVAEDSDGWLSVPKRLKIGCGHTTTSADGETILKEVIDLFEKIILGKVPVQSSEEQRGLAYDTWREKGTAVRFSVRAPRKLCEDARRQIHPLIEAAKAAQPSDSGFPDFFRKLRFGL